MKTPKLLCWVAAASAIGWGCGTKSNSEPNTAPEATVQPEPGPEGTKATGEATAPTGEATAPTTPTAAPTAGKSVLMPSSEVKLTAADGVVIHGIFYPTEQDKPRPMILLFHQARSNAGEYATIGPRLQALGYNALAIDQRSGGDRWGRKNQTVAGVGTSTKFLAAYPDLVAALTWANGQGYSRIAAWGSSYSASLVFKLGAEHPDDVQAILSFSPGEYMGKKGTVAGWASQVKAPVFATSAAGKEVAAAKAIIGQASQAMQYAPKHGVHGSSTLIAERNPRGHEDNWAAVEAFLRRVLR